ncbi:MAG TPA: hypothetical protein VGR16_15700 [Thermomicrobiales bacterium]|nr:hypothetical protein [Thermomicrobiales bacterium]
MTVNERPEVLHVTNGDAVGAQIERAGIGVHILPWRDLLSEGPVPARLSLINLADRRARFIDAAGWATYREARRAMATRDSELLRFKDYDEVVFWFEHDLTDQLQLLQAFDRFAARGGEGKRLTLVTTDRYPGVEPFHGLSQLDPDQLAELHERRRALTLDDFRLAQRGWDAFRSPDPAAIEAFLGEDTRRLPYLAPALRRHLEQFPAVGDGLSRTERATLQVLAERPRTLGDLFRATQDMEPAPFLSDRAYALHLRRLTEATRPLVRIADGGSLAASSYQDDDQGAALEITDRGRAVMEGRDDWADEGYPERWLGGVHLEPGQVLWRWDRTSSRLAPQEAVPGATDADGATSG